MDMKPITCPSCKGAKTFTEWDEVEEQEVTTDCDDCEVPASSLR